ncbi:MAG: protein TolQ [Sphingomonadaceae bacterium]|uniref:protein TolQ n=1 Tax=Thermaurantiacus sp. TaxID=2820283 RepID=UPI00298EDE1E|nr:protein TolQ [Thermaurantiacus sp.]MCS6986205.1 protein TolQ [Sphingomonadaceae bacterium]MDW8415862.1 protein TolQ [Thermaurantiacus sp.]
MDRLALTSAAELSPLALFLQADIVVKAVMLGLLMASVWSWAIILERSRTLRRLRRDVEAFERRFWKAGSLDELPLGRSDNPAAQVFRAGMDEWRASTHGRAAVDREGVRARLQGVMAAAVERAMSDLSDRLNWLATIGAVAPFVGLFGTVWGIMRAFVAIGQTQDTSLAVVAPGIAEALFATAIGLFAAIPAVVGYNRLQHAIGRLEDRLLAFSAAFHAMMSRELDRLGGG